VDVFDRLPVPKREERAQRYRAKLSARVGHWGTDQTGGWASGPNGPGSR
jgi:hypothetical protein